MTDNRLKFPQKYIEEPGALPRFPSTRYQGSKRKLIQNLYGVFNQLDFSAVLDLYSGSGTVSLLLRQMGKKVFANDYIKFNCNTAKLFLSLNRQELNLECTFKTLRYLLHEANFKSKTLVAENFQNVFFFDDENEQIDRFCQNLDGCMDSEKPLLIYAVGQSLLMKRPYNLFHRANLNMRERKVKRSFGNTKTWNTSILDHSKKIITELQNFPFQCPILNFRVSNENTKELTKLPKDVEVVYVDPPYLNKKGEPTNYAQFYHFLDGLCDYKLFESPDNSLANKPILDLASRWNQYESAISELREICQIWSHATLVFSYRNDGLPNKGEIEQIFRSSGRETIECLNIDYKYALSQQQETKEQIMVSPP